MMTMGWALEAFFLCSRLGAMTAASRAPAPRAILEGPPGAAKVGERLSTIPGILASASDAFGFVLLLKPFQ
jgi:hypothetical protein